MTGRKTILSGAFTVLLSAICMGGGGTGQTAEWASGASWYRVFAPRFHNGEPANDPEGTKPWTANWESKGLDPAPNAIYGEAPTPFGGDIQGLRARLPYLKRLGVSAIYLSPVFHSPSTHKYDTADLRHVDDSLAVAGSLARITGESRDPATWKFSDSDRLFLDFVKAAHDEGLRVVLEGIFSQVSNRSWSMQSVIRKARQSPCADWFRVTSWEPRISWETDKGYHGKLVPFKPDGDGFAPDLESYLHEITSRWMDPDGDGDPSDGVDGFGVFDAARMPQATVRRWREQIKRINPDGVLVGDFSGEFPTPQPVAPPIGEFDLTIDYALGRELGTFFRISSKPRDPQRLLSLLTSHHHDSTSRAKKSRIAAVSGGSIGRLLAEIDYRPGESNAGTKETSVVRPSPDAVSAWRLAMTLQYLACDSPMLFGGDEVGMLAEAGPDTRAPMWWQDIAASQAKPAAYREDFVALIRQLNNLRGRFKPLVNGGFRTVKLAGVSNVLAFARTLPGDEAIVVMNFGNTTQEVKLSAGWPGQFVGIVHPELAPGPLHPLLQRKQIAAQKRGDTGPPGLRLFGSRQYADEWGDITVKVTPMSVRLVIVRDKEPR